ncbi:MAG TPA: thiamine-phosphate kinase [Sandaracinaceae bacterium]
MDEFELIASIRSLLASEHAHVALGIGDDAAILAPMAGGAVLSVDAVVDGVHFDRRWLSLEDVGWRGYAAALSDLAAMGASPRAGLLSLVLSSALGDEDVLALVRGAGEAARAFGAPIVGGNLSRGTELSLTSTVVGEAPPAPLTRAGAREGDAVWVTGTLGAAALGLAALAAGKGDDREAAPFVARWRRPTPRFDAARALLGVATSAADVSDGLVQDLGHICEESGVGAVIEEALVPLADGHEALAESLGEDALLLALTGGEDYELVFTAPAGAEPPMATRIGRIERGERVRVLGRDGAERAIRRTGHRHR